VLLVRVCEDGLVVQQLLDLGEERFLLVIVVRLDKLVPCEGVPHEVGLVVVLHVRCLVVDGVVPSEDGVVKQSHVCRAGREEVGLRSSSHRSAREAREEGGRDEGTDLSRLELWRDDELHGTVCPRLRARRRLCCHDEG